MIQLMVLFMATTSYFFIYRGIKSIYRDIKKYGLSEIFKFHNIMAIILFSLGFILSLVSVYSSFS